jgi:hypothetical protein
MPKINIARIKSLFILAPFSQRTVEDFEPFEILGPDYRSISILNLEYSIRFINLDLLGRLR